MSKHLETGKLGEEAAIAYLREKQFQILHTNYRIKRAEIDIIALDKNTLVFIEVKTRKAHQELPENTVSEHKKEMLQTAMELFLEEHTTYKEIRFDILAITHQQHEILEITHLKDVFY